MDPVMTTEMFIPTVLDRSDCKKHNVPQGVPCFHVEPGSDNYPGYYAGICGGRIKRARFTGVVSPESMRKGFVKGHRPQAQGKKRVNA